MSAAALQAIAQMKAIRGMDCRPERLQWMRKLNGEAEFVLFRRRREWLMRAGSGLYLCNREWDELPEVVREKLAGVV